MVIGILINDPFKGVLDSVSSRSRLYIHPPLSDTPPIIHIHLKIPRTIKKISGISIKLVLHNSHHLHITVLYVIVLQSRIGRVILLFVQLCFKQYDYWIHFKCFFQLSNLKLFVFDYCNKR